MKKSCSSKKSAKFLEKQTGSLSFSTLATSLSDFQISSDDNLLSSVNNEISINLRRLEKKDPVTKLKSLNELLIKLPIVDNSSVIISLKFWSKIYAKLYLDEDKNVRELTQKLMHIYSKICGKEISSYIKQLLPIWIASQSDSHKPAADIAKESFYETFTDETKRKRAYFLCWSSTYANMKGVFGRSVKKISNVNLSPEEEEYVENLCVQLRTLLVVLPYLNTESSAMEDLKGLLKMKSFWAHFDNIHMIMSLYLELFIAVLQYTPDIVRENSCIASNFCICFRLIDNCHPFVIVYLWKCIDNCRNVLKDEIWSYISFKSVFFPKFIKVLESGMDGQLSLIICYVLLIIKHFPVSFQDAEGLKIIENILNVLNKALECSKVKHSVSELNAIARLYFGCSAFVAISAHKVENTNLVNFCIESSFNFAEKYLRSNQLIKLTDLIGSFTFIIIKSFYCKKVMSGEIIGDKLIKWLDEYYENELFCEKLTILLTDINRVTDSDFDSFKTLFFNQVMLNLQDKIILQNRTECLIPFSFILCQSSLVNELSSVCKEKLLSKFYLVIKEYECDNTYSILSMGLASMLNAADGIEMYCLFFNNLDENGRLLYFEKYYNHFINYLKEDDRYLITDFTLQFWLEEMRKELLDIPHDYKYNVDKLDAVLNILSINISHNRRYGEFIDGFYDIIKEIFDMPLSLEATDQLICVLNRIINHATTNSMTDHIPYLLIKYLMRLILCMDDLTDFNIDAVKDYLEYHCENENYKPATDLVIEIMSLTECMQFDKLSHFLATALAAMENDAVVDVLGNVKVMLVQDCVAIENSLSSEWLYNKFSNYEVLFTLMHKIYLLHYLDKNSTVLETIKVDVQLMSLMITGIISDQQFCNCQQTNEFLEFCDVIIKLSDECQQRNSNAFFDSLIKIFNSAVDSDHIVRKCPYLFVKMLLINIPIQRAKWSRYIEERVDYFIHNWADDSMDEKEFWFGVNVLLPKAVQARFIIQEEMLACLSSYLSIDNLPGIYEINKSVFIMNSLIRFDVSYFTVCYPILMEVRSIFEEYIDKLPHGCLGIIVSKNVFHLTELLQMLTFVVDCIQGNEIETCQWEFIFCILATLSRSEGFADCINYKVNSQDNERDYLINGYWLLKLIAMVSINMATVTNDAVVDEWENFFSETIFTTVMDQLTNISGSYEEGTIVMSNIFKIYVEALSETVALCPLSVVTNYSFPSSVDINDPIELPKKLLIILNFFLETMSNSSAAVQISAYNNLLNQIEQLRDHLNNEVNKKEVEECIESYKLSIPHKWLLYLKSENLLQLNVHSMSNQIVLTRCFLSWNLMLQLFAVAQPKLRGEITAFLSNSDNNLFANFMSFCFSFMPKNPIVVKSKFNCLTKYNGKNNINMISEDPELFLSCVEKRNNFQLLHLACFIFGRCVQTLPSLTRGWWLSLESNSQNTVEEYVKQFVTPQLFKREFSELKERIGTFNSAADSGADSEEDNKLEILAVPMVGEVTVRYHISEDQCVEQLIQLPNNYPLGQVNLQFKKEAHAVKDNKWRAWVIQITATMHNQNGTILDGVRLLKKNLDGYFRGLEECMICYALLHQTKYTLPSMKCRQCKKKFHKDCMFKWFQSSANPTCPNCRNIFFDGSYKRGWSSGFGGAGGGGGHGAGLGDMDELQNDLAMLW